MIRHLVPILFATLSFSASAYAADEALAIVNGISAGDLLNVRDKASPIGHVETRLGNGEALRKFECSDFNGYSWCKVQVVERPDITGWVPARYLLPVDPEGTATALSEDASIPEASAALATTPSSQGDTDASAATSQSKQDPGPAPAMAVPDLAARFGDPAPATEPAAAAQDQKTTPAGLTSAEADAYRLAFASQAAASDEQDAPDDAAASANDNALPSAGVMVEDEPPPPVAAKSAAAVPVPTPRPQLPGEQASITGQPAANEQKGTEVAAVASAAGQGEPAATQLAALPDELKAPTARTWDATGEIPCARYIGQPMTRCKAGVKREGNGKADVTVTWPDGGTRVIGFFGGKPAGANSRADFRFTREGSLNMIRIGVSERFEIPDALAFGG